MERTKIDFNLQRISPAKQVTSMTIFNLVFYIIDLYFKKKSNAISEIMNKFFLRNIRQRATMPLFDVKRMAEKMKRL